MIDLQAIQERLEAATRCSYNDQPETHVIMPEASVDALIDEVKRLRAALEEACSFFGSEWMGHTRRPNLAAYLKERSASPEQRGVE